MIPMANFKHGYIENTFSAVYDTADVQVIGEVLMPVEFHLFPARWSMADTIGDSKLSLRGEWLGMLAYATRGLRAKGVSVWLGEQLLCQLRFDRRLNIPARHFLVGPLSNSLLSWRLGERVRAGIRGPRSVVELVSHLLSPVAEQELQEVLDYLRENYPYPCCVYWWVRPWRRH